MVVRPMNLGHFGHPERLALAIEQAKELKRLCGHAAEVRWRVQGQRDCEFLGIQKSVSHLSLVIRGVRVEDACPSKDFFAEVAHQGS